MSNVLFPALPGLSFDVKRTPVWKTRLQESVSGKETRQADWSYPRWKWSFPYDLLRDTASQQELRTLVGFFLQRQGMYDSFLLQDADDYTVTGQPIGTGTGAQTQYQLVRTYGGFVEPMKEPNSISALKVNGSSAPFTHLGSGLVQFNSAPANGTALTADFTYYFRARFEVDDIGDLAKFADKLWKLGRLELISLK